MGKTFCIKIYEIYGSKYKNKIFDVDRGVDNVDNFVDKMWISVDKRSGEFEGIIKKCRKHKRKWRVGV